MAATSSIQVQVVSGSDLPRMDVPGKIDAYVSTKVEDPADGKVVAQSVTSVVRYNYNPRWNHVFSVPASPNSHRYVVRFLVLDSDLFSSDTVGEVVVPLSTLLSNGAPRDFPIPLEPKVTPLQPGQVPSLKVGASSESPSAAQSSSTPAAPSDLAPLKVTVSVHKATALPKRDLFGKIDPFVVVTAVDSLTGRELAPRLHTETISSEYNPTWNFSGSFDIVPDPHTRPRIEFLVFDKDTRAKSDAAGTTEVAVQPLSATTALTLRLPPSTRPSGKAPASQLFVSVSLSGPAPAEWAADLVDRSGISQAQQRPWLNVLLNSDASVDLRVKAVETMDQPSLDSHFNTALLRDVRGQMDSGDILLFRGTGEFSNRIRWASRSNYSHSAIIIRSPPDDIKQLYLYDQYLQKIREFAATNFPELLDTMLSDDVFVFEAETDIVLRPDPLGGLQLMPITFWLAYYYAVAVKDPDLLLVWRKLVRQPVGSGSGESLNAEQRSKLWMWMREIHGRHYKYALFRQVFGALKWNLTKDYSTFYCSELVAASLSEVGVLPSDIIGTNYLPVDFTSEERHEGHDIVLNEPYAYLRERRIRLIPAAAQVDSGTTAFAFTDIERYRIQQFNAGVRPFEELIAADRLSGNADIEVLKATLRADGDATAAQSKQAALETGWIRPYLAIVSLHPFVRAQLAKLLQVTILEATADQWYGNAHRQAWDILGKLALYSGQPNWASALIDSAGNFCEDTRALVAPVVEKSTAVERDAASCGDLIFEVDVLRPLEIAVVSVFRPLVQQRFPAQPTDASASAAASSPGSLAELRTSLGDHGHLLDIVLTRLEPIAACLSEQQVLDFCVFMFNGGQKKLVQIVNEQFSIIADSKKSVRKSLPLIFAQLSLQVFFLYLEGIESLRPFYTSESASASSSSSTAQSHATASL